MSVHESCQNSEPERAWREVLSGEFVVEQLPRHLQVLETVHGLDLQVRLLQSLFTLLEEHALESGTVQQTGEAEGLFCELL